MREKREKKKGGDEERKKKGREAKRKRNERKKNLNQTSEQGLFSLHLLRACLHGKVRVEEVTV